MVLEVVTARVGAVGTDVSMVGAGVLVILHGQISVLKVAVLAQGHGLARFCCD
jgi:hypothetical protein